MNRTFSIFQTIVSAFIDFFYRNPVKRSIINFASQKVIFPGQIWLLPGVGQVLVQEADDTTISYWASVGAHSSPFLSSQMRLYRTSRKSFSTWCMQGFELEETNSSLDEDNNNIVQFNRKDS